MFTGSSSNAKKAATKKPVAAAPSAENATEGPKPFSASVKANAHALTKVKSGFIVKKDKPAPSKVVGVDKSVQVQPDAFPASLVTSDKPSLEYWKLLAEERERQAEKVNKAYAELELKYEALEEENMSNKRQLEILKEENRTMEEMLEDAKKMAEYIQALPDDYHDDDQGDNVAA